MMRKVLILGIGNTLRSDDGLGVYIVRHIEESGIALPEGVEVLDGGTAGFDLLGLIDGYDKIVIVDALKVDDRPGSIYRFTPEHAVERRAQFSLHEVGIMEVIKTLRIMDFNPEIEFVGIVPDNINDIDTNISSAVKDSIPRAVEVILEAATH
ncbi:MAG TPA: hydrogenase maturation protease [Spirochaetota bacterium]|nr:hydrogenase maturation protease [Spirochaetota bacterium]HOD15355.1 hydrogenase maturation protease [Spirochaetota bacterium]HPG51395.1 hydrogenase maturation protease [Spirochaetota bacterium]HPN11774.1 hydrogenase maturation protease [Spirochaetota bacterium]